MKVACVGDVHIASIPPRSRTDTYTVDILEKLSFISNYCEDNDINHAIYAGDLFNLKAPSKNPHWLIQDTYEAMHRPDLINHIVPGNHDMSYNDSSLEGQALATLGNMKGIEILNGWSDYNVPFYGIPYTEMDEEIITQFYFDAEAIEAKGSTSYVVASHLSIFPDNMNPPYDYMHASDYANNVIINKNDKVLLLVGHIHDSFKHFNPLEEYHNIIFANYGAISRGSLHDETVRRKPQFFIYDTETQEIEVIDIPHKPAEEVFKLEAAEIVKEQKKSMTSFLDSLSNTQFTATSSSQVLDTARSEGVGSEVIEQIEELLDFGS